jgi:hypothetical protein
VVTLTAQQLYDVQLRAGVAPAPLALKAFPAIKIGAAAAAKVVHVQSTSFPSTLPNIIRNSAANVTFVPTGKVVTPMSLQQQQHGDTVKTVLELKGQSDVADAGGSRRTLAPDKAKPCEAKFEQRVEVNSKDIVTTIVVNGKLDEGRESS